MKLFFHYCPISFSNCYILGADMGQEAPVSGEPEAVLIDPGYMDVGIINFIEDNGYYLRAVLITHDHKNHIRGLKTLLRIYDADIYAVNQIVLDYKTILVRDRDICRVGPFTFEVISVPGHSPDSAVFKINNLLFTGDALSAGLVGRTASRYGAATQMTALQNKIFSLPGDFTILPGHGPPSSLDAERRFNAGIELYEQSKTHLPWRQSPWLAAGLGGGAHLTSGLSRSVPLPTAGAGGDD
ncbi:MAG: MBL fold metallo-hydrolase [Spirochaetaceae bacterium]|jgi:glyoxylase-like metal-dependent hydrolase (beta-lactamase superfamily II)|nr:MBL fold metallo-hydrolase [Spirochaetaceae bacterium]